LTLNPDTKEEIATSLVNELKAQNSNLTDFSEDSPEKDIVDAYAAYIEEFNAALLAAQLSGWPEYAGKTLTEDDREDLGLDDDVDLSLVNKYQKDSHLDHLARINSIQRDPGNEATGTVTFTVANAGIVVPKGTEVATQPDSDGNYLSFYTTADASPSSGTTVSVGVEAEAVGTEYNVGSDSLTYMPSPPAGVNDVTNNSATSGGEDEETTVELRERLLQPPTALGGTKQGIVDSLVRAFDGVTEDDVVVEENTNASPPNGDVVVFGGPTDSEVQSEIDEAKPNGVAHSLVRPTKLTIDVTADLNGTDIDVSRTENDVKEFISNLGLGEDLSRSRLYAVIHNADEDIQDVDNLSVTKNGNSVTDDVSVGAKEVTEVGTVSLTVV
jgi:uncharacterized phage protein gp47/JayE